MVCIFSWHRPRGIAGNYIVTIELELAETETVQVEVSRNREHHCGSCGIQHPIAEGLAPALTRGRQELYRVDNIVVDDYITLTIRDQNVFPPQQSRHVAHMDTFAHGMLSFAHGNHVWSIVSLNPLLLIDRDVSDEPYAQLYDTPSPVPIQRASIVEAEQPPAPYSFFKYLITGRRN